MFELIKKTLLAGLGTAVITRTKVKEIMEKMVDQGKITSEEAERYTQELMENGEKELKEISDQISKSLGRLPSTFNLAEKDTLDALLSRVDNLEKRLDLVEDNLIKHVHEARQATETQSQ